MAITALNLPTDIPWERICVTTDMVDPDRGPAETPPLWQSSMALYRYTPPAEYQVYPGRRIIYYKLAATISNYQPKAQQVLGTLDPNGLSTGTIRDEEVKRRIAESLPCSAAIVQVTVTPKEADRKLHEYPYFVDVQPRSRALYEQATETKERASRSLETLQLRKDAATSNSIEVLDIEQGGSLQGGFAGISAGGSQQGQWGTKSIGKDDTSNITTTDSSREARETLAFTTQLSQMYTLLQAYHLGTNRVFFYITPRPHVVEPPSGIAGPRALDGVQDLFLVVSQAEDDALPCITARLDTGHLALRPVLGYDRSLAPEMVTLDISAPSPIENDPAGTPTDVGGSTFYACWSKSITRTASSSQHTGYMIENVTELTNSMTGKSGFTNDSTITLLPDAATPRQLVINGTATGYACHRNGAGDAANFVLHPSGGPTNTPLWPDSLGIEPGRVIRTVSISFRSELPNVKLGEEYVVALTTRQLKCCDTISVTPPKLVGYVPVTFIEATLVLPSPPATAGGGSPPVPNPSGPVTTTPAVPTTPGTTSGSGTAAARSGMTLAQVNALQQQLAETTQRLSAGLADVAAAASRDDDFVMQSLVAAVTDDPRRAKSLRSSASTLSLDQKTLEKVAEMLGRSAGQLTRFDVLSAPGAVLSAATGRSGADLLRLQLEAAGLPTRAAGAADRTSSPPSVEPQMANRPASKPTSHSKPRPRK